MYRARASPPPCPSPSLLHRPLPCPAHSAIPNALHHHVLQQCLEHGVHLVTPSYSTPDFEAADSVARERGLTVFCEQGLDPGIDHMLAMECIDHAHAKGGVVIGFVSYCGGLPAPESAGNPLGYKFR